MLLGPATPRAKLLPTSRRRIVLLGLQLVTLDPTTQVVAFPSCSAVTTVDQLVENVIRDIKPQIVMVELDAKRVGSFIAASQKVGPHAVDVHAVEDGSLVTVFFHVRLGHLAFSGGSPS